MYDQLLQETELTLTALAQERDVSLPTVWRWARRGIRGYVLETFSIGGRTFTTREAFSRWVMRISGNRCPVQDTPTRRARALEHAEQLATSLGV